MSTTPDPGTSTSRPPRRAYRPGAWFGIVGERAVVVLPPTEKPRVAPLWELVDGGAGFDVVLDALISGGLRELPGFVLVSTTEGQTRLVLRGAARAEVDLDGESVVLEGSAATTWVERTLTGVRRISLVLDDGHDEAPGETAHTVDGGLFRLSRYDESPAHEGEDEAGAEPAYEREFPLSVPGPADIDTEPDAELASEPAETEPDVDAAPERSPEPPSWTPAPPPPPLAPPPAPPVPPTPPGPESAADAADHDGLTRTGSWEPPAVAAPGIPGQPPAPDVTRAVARLEVAGGEIVEVDRAIVFGRAPEPRRFSPSEQPRLITVHSPHLEVSSTHLEIRPGIGADHGSAVATDLGSTNGTVLVQAGMPPQDLEAGQAVQLLPGAVLDLGDGVLIRVSQPAR